MTYGIPALLLLALLVSQATASPFLDDRFEGSKSAPDDSLEWDSQENDVDVIKPKLSALGFIPTEEDEPLRVLSIRTNSTLTKSNFWIRASEKIMVFNETAPTVLEMEVTVDRPYSFYAAWLKLKVASGEHHPAHMEDVSTQLHTLCPPFHKAGDHNPLHHCHVHGSRTATVAISINHSPFRRHLLFQRFQKLLVEVTLQDTALILASGHVIATADYQPTAQEWDRKERKRQMGCSGEEEENALDDLDP